MRSQTDTETLGRILADLDQVDTVVTWSGTHSQDCWRWHAPCLAARIRNLITGRAA